MIHNNTKFIGFLLFTCFVKAPDLNNEACQLLRMETMILDRSWLNSPSCTPLCAFRNGSSCPDCSGASSSSSSFSCLFVELLPIQLLLNTSVVRLLYVENLFWYPISLNHIRTSQELDLLISNKRMSVLSLLKVQLSKHSNHSSSWQRLLWAYSLWTLITYCPACHPWTLMLHCCPTFVKLNLFVCWGLTEGEQNADSNNDLRPVVPPEPVKQGQPSLPKQSTQVSISPPLFQE